MIFTTLLVALYLLSVAVTFPGNVKLNNKRISDEWPYHRGALRPRFTGGEISAMSVAPVLNVIYLVTQSADYATNKVKYDIQAERYRLIVKDEHEHLRNQLDREKADRLHRLEAAADRAYKELQSVRDS